MDDPSLDERIARRLRQKFLAFREPGISFAPFASLPPDDQALWLGMAAVALEEARRQIRVEDSNRKERVA